MIRKSNAGGLLWILFVAAALAANPYLDAVDERPTFATFKGVEWNDEWAPDEVPLTARVETRRLAKTPWGAIFRTSFQTLASKAPDRRELTPLHFIVTDERIVLLNDADMKSAIDKLTAMEKPPEFEPSDLRALNKGEQKIADQLVKETVGVKGDRCAYSYSHNSGHFTRMIWQRGIGLIEFTQGYGAQRWFSNHSRKRA